MPEFEIRTLVKEQVKEHYEIILRRSFKINWVEIKDESKKWCYNRFIRKSNQNKKGIDQSFLALPISSYINYKLD